MRRLWLPLAALLWLTGCGNYLEMTRMNFVAGLAIDRGPDGYAVTVEALDLSGSPEDSELDSFFRVKGEGPTLPKAMEAIQSRLAYRLRYSGLETVVIHEDVAREEGLGDVLDWFTRDVELCEAASLMISRGQPAEEVLSAEGQDVKGVSWALENLINPLGRESARTVRRPVYRVTDILSTPGKSLTLPAISVTPEEKEDGGQAEESGGEEAGTVRLDGLAVFSGDRLTGYLEQERVPYYLCLIGSPDKSEFVLHVDGEGDVPQTVELRIQNSGTRRAVRKDAPAAFQIKVRAKGRVSQTLGGPSSAGGASSAGGPSSLNWMDQLERQAAEQFKRELRQTVEIIQTELGADILALGYELYLHSGALWEGSADPWDKRFEEADVEIDADVRVFSSGNTV